ncbi:hypothetical protein PUN28_005190 [Cardiocondyla obscurior]|uniref:Secreted protein n=1 Tax=Cardiocondyla obscurior TaxID=286306 RepID=A0AAW2GJ76_9HYME
MLTYLKKKKRKIIVLLNILKITNFFTLFVGRVHGKKIDATEGRGGHRGKLQREDYRQLDYQATTSLFWLSRASERTSEPSMSFKSSLSFDALVT